MRPLKIISGSSITVQLLTASLFTALTLLTNSSVATAAADTPAPPTFPVVVVDDGVTKPGVFENADDPYPGGWDPAWECDANPGNCVPGSVRSSACASLCDGQ